MSYLILDLASRFCDGFYFDTSAASDALAYHRIRWPNGRWLMLQVRAERDRPSGERTLPLMDVERQRLGSAR